MKLYSIEEGRQLLKAARDAIELHLTTPYFKNEMVERHIERFNEHYGVYVTIEHYPTETLRGCIGFPRARLPIKKLLIEAAIAAATEDPRFVPVSHMEFEHMVVGTSILSRPALIKAKKQEEIKSEIKAGIDGLMIEYGYHSGLLLPIVAWKHKWNTEEFLDNVCIKAGLPEHTWKTGIGTLHKFTAQVFKELSPRGPVEEILFE